MTGGKDRKKKITVIVPCYNEEASLHYFYEEIQRVAAQMTETAFEYLFVDDGSRDGTMKVIRELAAKDKKVAYVSFSRNFGKEAAMYAGLRHAGGDYVVIMDADLQDPPSLLPQMYHAVTEEGYDSVATRRVTRKGEPAIRSFFARRFYHLMNRISDVELMDGARDYRLMSRAYVDALLSLGEYNRFSKGLFGWVGFRTKWLEFENVERVAGETKWSFWKLFRYSLDGIVAFSSTPLYISSILGAGMCGIAVMAILFIIVRQLLFGGSAYGWPSMACIVILIGGLQLLCVGILGLYLSKAYLEVKHRPIYIAREISGADANEKELPS
ncbi:MAG: glycosyltransferase family 2 protein [Roseburia sp.]|jgi:glucosyltransferase|nr:glycosyltransferase family 2 protein [Roseburia sp.]